MRRWKRSDISERLVLEVYSRPLEDRFPADEVLMRETGAPKKVVWAAMMREDGRGSLDYGLNLRGGWLTKEGEARLAALRESGEERAMRCRKCDVEMVKGRALAQTFTSAEPDFLGSEIVTLSPGGPGRLVPCWKCPCCGRSLSASEGTT